MRMAESKMSLTYIVAKLDASALMLVASSQVDTMSVSTIDGNDGRAVGGCQRTEDGSELVSGPGLCVVLRWLILSAADNSSLRCHEISLCSNWREYWQDARGLAYLLATLKLLDVVNLWRGKAVVDFNPLHGDILSRSRSQRKVSS